MVNNVVMQDMRKSMAFVDKARPIIAGLLNGGYILPVEGDDNEVCKMLDMTCGTDYFQVYKNTGLVYGIASRFQYGKNWASFTVRKARQSGAVTEYEKRKKAIERGGIYPYLTMQAYIDEVSVEVNGLAIVKTTDLMRFVDDGLAYEQHTRQDQIGQAAFYVAYWDKMQRAGYKVLVYDSKQNKQTA